MRGTEQLPLSWHQTDPDRLILEASELGWPPGHFPSIVYCAMCGEILRWTVSAPLPDGGRIYTCRQYLGEIHVLND